MVGLSVPTNQPTLVGASKTRPALQSQYSWENCEDIFTKKLWYDHGIRYGYEISNHLQYIIDVS